MKKNSNRSHHKNNWLKANALMKSMRKAQIKQANRKTKGGK